jgi:hypothetical protein
MWRIFLLLFVILAMVSITMVYNYNSTQSIINSQTSKIVQEISHKLDIVHNQTNDLISNQGNLSQAQRQKIITEFENLPVSGIASHDDIYNLIGNISHKNANIDLQRDNNLVLHKLLDIIQNQTNMTSIERRTG